MTNNSSTEAAAGKWPSYCQSPGSCTRNRACMYTNCKHEGHDIGPAIDEAIANPRAFLDDGPQEAAAGKDDLLWRLEEGPVSFHDARWTMAKAATEIASLRERVKELEKEVDFQRRRANSAETGWLADTVRWQVDIDRAETAERKLAKAMEALAHISDFVSGRFLDMHSGRCGCFFP